MGDEKFESSEVLKFLAKFISRYTRFLMGALTRLHIARGF